MTTRLPTFLPLLCALSFLLSFLVARFALSWSLLASALVGCFAAYVPTYVDGSEYEPLNWRYSPPFARLRMWSSVATYFRGRVIYEASKAEYEAAGGGSNRGGRAESSKQYSVGRSPSRCGVVESRAVLH